MKSQVLVTIGLVSAYIIGYIGIFLIISIWTQDELAYLISKIENHVVHIPYVIAILLTALLNGFALSFDCIMWLLRSASII